MVKTTNLESALASIAFDVDQRLNAGWTEEEIIRFLYLRARSLYKRYAVEARYNRNVILPTTEQLDEMEVLDDSLEQF